MLQKNIFQKIIDKEIMADILYEDKDTIVFLDINPLEKGHLLVVPKKAYKTIWEMSENDYLKLSKIVLKFSKKIRKEMNCGLNICQNNLKIANQEIPHVHFHLIPRTKNKSFSHCLDDREKYTSEEEKEKFIKKLKIK